MANMMKDLVENVQQQLKLVRTAAEVQRLWALNAKNTVYLEKLVKQCRGNVGEKKQFESALGQLKSYQAQLKRKLKVGRGGGGTQQEQSVQWREISSAFKSRVKTGVIVNHGILDPKAFLDAAADVFINQIRISLQRRMPALKVNVVLCGEYCMPHDPEITSTKFFSTPNHEINRYSDLGEIFKLMKDRLLNMMSEFEVEGSGWSLVQVINLAVNTNKFVPLSAAKYVELPQFIKNKNAIINVKNTDEKCFGYALVSALYPAKNNLNNPSSYPQNFEELFNLKGISFPVKISDIAKFERQNPTISINVYGVEKKKNANGVEQMRDKIIGPFYHTREVKEKHVNLLYLENPGRKSGHYCFIKSMSRLCRSQFTKHRRQTYICDRCLRHFYSEERLTIHSEDCARVDPVRIEFPKPSEKFLYFKNHHFNLRQPWTVYADFECLVQVVEPSGEYMDDNDEEDERVPTSFTRQVQRHVPYSVGYQVVCSFDESLSHYESYRGKNPEKWLIQQLRDETAKIEAMGRKKLPMRPLTPQEQMEYENTTICKHCLRPYVNTEVIKVRDHDHYTGEYRFPLCYTCNLNYKPEPVIPIIMHNISGYDIHFIIKELDFDEGRIEVLPITDESYISVTKLCGDTKWRFIDSYRFMGKSLDSLAKNLTPDMFKYVRAAFPPEQFELMTRKGSLCYDYLDSWDKLEEECLPPKEKFYSKLTEQHISDEDFIHAQRVWSRCGVKTLGEYTDIYLKCDVKILTDVFEQFRDLCMKIYDLDSAHFYTGPGLAWMAALKKTRVRLELLCNIDQVLFLEKGIKGGLTQCSHRYVQANNKYMGDAYDPSKPSNCILYSDANNLYGYSMSQALPYKDFRWLTQKQVELVEKRLKQVRAKENAKMEEDYSDTACSRVLFGDEDVSKSLILEVDLEYPAEVHEKHKDLPFCPEHRVPPGSKNSKLMATLYHKEKYVIHARNLLQCLLHGMRLKKVHRALGFTQAPWLKSYIDLNTDMRTEAKNDFEKDFFKLMNNSVFGKTMENIRNHRTIILATSWKQARKLIAKAEFKSRTIFKENLIAVELRRTKLKYNKPIYTGMAILDLSKLLMYSFYYEFVKNELSERCPSKLLYMDTDSYVISFEDKGKGDIYDIIREESEKGAEGVFDTFDYGSNNPHGIAPVNKKIIGKFKDELNGQILTEFIGLRAKMYAFKVNGRDHTKKAKGVSRTALKNRITFRTYYNCLFRGQNVSTINHTIRSRKHDIFTFKIRKSALDPRDDKRDILKDMVTTLPWGYTATHS